MSFWSELNRTTFALKSVSAGGVATRYLEAGKGPRTVLFLHGVAGHLEMFARNVAAHAEGYRVLVPDMLGHGYTAKPDRDYEIRDYVEHVLAFLEAADAGTVSIAGTSLGGWVAGRLAAAHPGRFVSLSLISSGGLTAYPTVMNKLNTLSSAAAADSNHDAVRARLKYVVHDPALVTDELVEIRARIYAEPAYQRAIPHIMCLQQMEIRQRNLLTVEELGRVVAPTLVAWTEHDPTASLDDGRRYADAVKGARFVVFEHSSHMPQYEEPERFNAVHMEFLEGAWTRWQG